MSICRVTAVQASTVSVVVVDSCGDWPTVVGGGATAYYPYFVESEELADARSSVRGRFSSTGLEAGASFHDRPLVPSVPTGADSTKYR